jgi:hypothetical protein
VTHWAHGGETSKDNLVMLCRRHHHRLVHEGGVRLERDADALVRFRLRHGTTLGFCAAASGRQRRRARPG